MAGQYGRKEGTTLGGAARAAGWATPTTRDHKDGSAQSTQNVPVNALLGRMVHAAQGWNTPRATDGSNGGPNQAGGALPADAAMAGWPTPNVADDNNSRAKDLKAYSEKRLLGGYSNLATTAQATVDPATGPAPSGIPAATGKRAALNPAFSLWLMGYPTAWASCGARVMRSSRKSQRSSSQPTGSA